VLGGSGHDELRRFFTEGGRRRPSELVRWYRTGEWLTDGHRLLVWEYPRQAPDGDQVDLVEFMEIVGGLIAYHRSAFRRDADAIPTRSGCCCPIASRQGRQHHFV
jgi:hypothetical protein